MANQNEVRVISSDQLARMSDAELVETLRIVGSQLGERAMLGVRGRLVEAAKELEGELDRRTPDSGDTVAEEVVTEASQLPPAAEVDAVALVTRPGLSSPTVVNAVAGAGAGYVVSLVLKKRAKALVILGAVAGALLRPIGR